jgi:hypothetical protein
VRVDSKGDDRGDVEQSNDVESDATAANVNATEQDADQEQGGSKCGCHGATGVQAIGQEARNEQGALAGSLALQVGGHGKCGCSSGGNSNAPVRVDSKGDDRGSVKQSNDVESKAIGLNVNSTKQKADQKQGGRDHRPGHGEKRHDRGGSCGASSGHSARGGSGFSWWHPATRRVPYC